MAAHEPDQLQRAAEVLRRRINEGTTGSE